MAQTSGNRDEPSMEDILSSIRKIIQSNEDKDGAGSAEQASEQSAVQPSAEPSKQMEPVSSPEVSRPVEAAVPVSVNAEVQSERGELTDAPARAPQAAEQSVEANVPVVAEAPAPIATKPVAPVTMPKADLEPVPSLAAQVVSSTQETGVKDVVAALEEKLNSPEADEVVASKETTNSVPALLSRDSGAKVAASFAELTQKLEEHSEMNLEEMASDMLRPMLQDWLDDNLPSLVEKLVREEIERVARGG